MEALVFLCDCLIGSPVVDSFQFQNKLFFFFSGSILGYPGNQSKGTSSETRAGELLTLHVSYLCRMVSPNGGLKTFISTFKNDTLL